MLKELYTKYVIWEDSEVHINLGDYIITTNNFTVLNSCLLLYILILIINDL